MSGFQIGPETWVSVEARVFDAEGESASEPETIGFVFGLGALFPKVERALEMRLEGDVVRVPLEPKDAFGRRDPKAVLEVAREEFPPDVAPGDRFEVENEDGGVLVLSVLEVLEDAVVVDSNHPLADQTVTVEVRVLEVRPATEEEIRTQLEEREAEARGLGLGTPDASLLPADRLLRGRPGR